MRSLIIGTAGQLAMELHRRHATTGVELAAAQRVEIAEPPALYALLERERPELVINASAYTAVDRAEDERERAFAVNAEGPRHLARWCGANGAALIHVSTDYVFDGSKPSPYTEQDVAAPLNVYGESKLAGEFAIRDELDRYLVFRTSWLFSAHGNNFVKTVRRLARERDELRIVADQRGRPTSAADLADAIWRVTDQWLLNERSVPWGTYHVANADPVTWHALAEAIFDIEATRDLRRPRVTAISSADYPTPARRPVNSVLDTARFETIFGFKLRPFRAALGEVLVELESS